MLSVRFEKIKLDNHVCFPGSQEIVFSQHLNVILGGGGSGKTTIFNALASIGPETGRVSDRELRTLETAVAVSTSGDRGLLSKYRDIIFLGDDGADRALSQELWKLKTGANISSSPYARHREAIVDEAIKVLSNSLLAHKPWKYEEHKDLNPRYMAVGEHSLFGYAYMFAVRTVLDLDLPLVLDVPYTVLDANLRAGLREFLREREWQHQQIIFLRGHEMDMYEGEVSYELLPSVNTPGGTVVTKCS